MHIKDSAQCYLGLQIRTKSYSSPTAFNTSSAPVFFGAVLARAGFEVGTPAGTDADEAASWRGRH